MKEIFKTFLALILTALTPDGGAIPPELQTEIDALTASIDALPDAGSEGAPPAGNKVTENEIADKMTNLAGKIKNTATQSLVLNKILEAKMVAINAAIKVND